MLVQIKHAWHNVFSGLCMVKFTFDDLWCSTSDMIYTSFQTVVFCLVDIYIMLGKAFVPYLEGLSSTQLRLVTIYANRISQARSGAPIDANQWIVLLLCTTWTFGWMGRDIGFHSFVHLYRTDRWCSCMYLLAFLVWYCSSMSCVTFYHSHYKWKQENLHGACLSPVFL